MKKEAMNYPPKNIEDMMSLLQQYSPLMFHMLKQIDLDDSKYEELFQQVQLGVKQLSDEIKLPGSEGHSIGLKTYMSLVERIASKFVEENNPAAFEKYKTASSKGGLVKVAFESGDLESLEYKFMDEAVKFVIENKTSGISAGRLFGNFMHKIQIENGRVFSMLPNDIKEPIMKRIKSVFYKTCDKYLEKDVPTMMGDKVQFTVPFEQEDVDIVEKDIRQDVVNYIIEYAKPKSSAKFLYSGFLNRLGTNKQKTLFMMPKDVRDPMMERIKDFYFQMWKKYVNVNNERSLTKMTPQESEKFYGKLINAANRFESMGMYKAASVIDNIIKDVKNGACN